MRITVVAPVGPNSRNGNHVTMNRWARQFKNLGHIVSLASEYVDNDTDLLVAIHAIRSASSILRFHANHPETPIVVLLSGTDVYGSLYESPGPQVLDIANKLITLQELAVNELHSEHSKKAITIIQSAEPTPGPGPAKNPRHFDICVIGHLREVKDPFRAALAARNLPQTSLIRILQVGDAMTPVFATEANRLAMSPRYRWLDNLPRWKARRMMKRSQVMVISSISEGGANVVSEAIVDEVPIIASYIPGNIGLLGENFPGYFDPGDTNALRDLMVRSEKEVGFLDDLRAATKHLKSSLTSEHEQLQWQELIQSLKSD